MNNKITQLNIPNKYNEIKEYLNNSNFYWLENDVWDMHEMYKYDLKKAKNQRIIDLSIFDNKIIKLEVKFILINLFDNKLKNIVNFMRLSKGGIKCLNEYANKIKLNSLLDFEEQQFKMYCLNQRNIKISSYKTYSSIYLTGIKILFDFFDEREETEKDIWNCKRINGVRISSTKYFKGYILNFTMISENYRECVKRYFRTIITKKSFSHCRNILNALSSFFKIFYEMGYKERFLKDLSREDIEKYILKLTEKYKDKNVTYMNKFLAYPRTFLEYIQLAGYTEAPQKEVSFLIFQDDIPKREKDIDRLQRVKFIAEPILEELDNNILELDRKELIPIYILLRETRLAWCRYI